MTNFLRSFLIRFQAPFFIPAALLVLIGLVMLYSLDTTLFRQQLIVFIFAGVVYFFFLSIDYSLFKYLAKYIYIGMLIALITVFFIGVEVKGSVRWVELFGFRLQFSEVLKPFYIVFLAQYLSSNNSRSFIKFTIALLLLFPIFFLILKQPDLGNALVYAFITIFMLIFYGFPWRFFLILGGTGAVLFPILLQMLHGYQKERLMSFFGASKDFLGSSYNSIQALISIGSGGIFGKGLGEGTQSLLKFLPERHTDFIFAAISESLGFVGSAFIIIVYGVLLYQVYKTSRTTSDPFSYLVVIGIYFLILTHIAFNIGMNLAILPIVGITLPFISYGGSSLITNFISLALLSSIRFDNNKRDTLEIR